MTSAITVRHPEFDFAELDRHWLAGSRLATAYGNAGHVFIPLGEQFFIDAVRRFRGRVTDDDQRDDIRAFIGQEAVHARAHRAIWQRLRADGVPVDGYADWIAWVGRAARFVPGPLQLSITAALEHYTAAFGTAFIAEELGSVVPDEMARLLEWHGLEEIEHRSVAFDLLQLVDDSYALRVAGFVLGTGLLMVVPMVGTVWFAIADRSPREQRRHGLGEMSARFARRMGRHVAAYLARSFHPANVRD